MKTHIFPFTIAYADTDAEGIVYHARYLEIAERARMNWLRGKLNADGDVGFVVRELNIKRRNRPEILFCIGRMYGART